MSRIFAAQAASDAKIKDLTRPAAGAAADGRFSVRQNDDIVVPLFFIYQRHRVGGDAGAVAGEAQLFLRGRLDAHVVS